MDTLGSRLKKARLDAGFTMQKLADSLGISTSAIAQFEGDKTSPQLERAIKLAETLNVSLEWLVGGSQRAAGAQDAKYYAPLLDRVQAGLWADIVSPPSLPDGIRYLELDQKPRGFALALEIGGESMTPEFIPGDIVILDTGLDPLPGDYVAALVDNDNQATFKKYRPRGTIDDGNPIIELAPLNPDYPVLHINARSPGRIVGTMIEHRRYRRRR